MVYRQFTIQVSPSFYGMLPEDHSDRKSRFANNCAPRLALPLATRHGRSVKKALEAPEPPSCARRSCLPSEPTPQTPLRAPEDLHVDLTPEHFAFLRECGV